MPKNPKRTAAFEAHVQYELSKLKGDGLKNTINEETTALFVWFDDVCLKDFTNAKNTWDFFRRNVIEAPILDEMPEYLTECAKIVHSCMRKDPTKLKDIMPKKMYDKLVGSIIELTDLKKEIINQAVNSSIYTMLITDTLHAGIKDFVISENVVMKKIPGASTILNFGAGILNKTTFGLAGNIADGIDDKLKSFIESNIQQTLANNEEFLIESLDENLLHELGDELWESFSKYSAHSLTEFIEPSNVESVAPVVRDFWIHFRKTSIFKKVSKAIIEYYFKRNGDKKIKILLEEIGITREKVQNELNEAVLPVLKNEIVSDYLESRIRAHLAGYYFSEIGIV